MARIAWEFFDYSTSDTYLLPINPNEGGTPTYEKNLSVNNTTAPGGRTLIFEGADSPQRGSVSGVLLTEDQHDQFIAWWDKRSIIRITDDLYRTFDVYIERLAMQRVRSVTHPWRHTFTIDYVITSGY